MQLNDYECRICGHKFEVFQPMGARDIASCPKCSCVADRKFSACNFHFGWTLAPESRWVDGAKDKFVRNI